MRFTKMHGAGNDYVYVDARGLNNDWPNLSRQISDRHFGIGGEQQARLTPLVRVGQVPRRLRARRGYDRRLRRHLEGTAYR